MDAQMRSLCPLCGGRGDVIRYRGTILLRGAETGTIGVPEQCKTCDGRGYLDGFVPPA